MVDLLLITTGENVFNVRVEFKYFQIQPINIALLIQNTKLHLGYGH